MHVCLTQKNSGSGFWLACFLLVLPCCFFHGRDSVRRYILFILKSLPHQFHTNMQVWWHVWFVFTLLIAIKPLISWSQHYESAISINTETSHGKCFPEAATLIIRCHFADEYIQLLSWWGRKPRQVCVAMELIVTLPISCITPDKHVSCYHLIIVASWDSTSMD